VERLRARRGTVSGAGVSSRPAQVAAPPPADAPLHAVLDAFWSSGRELESLHVSPFATEAPDAILRQLGPAPVEAAGRNLTDLLAPAYRTLAQTAERKALTE
jgi:hypothetical protein